MPIFLAEQINLLYGWIQMLLFTFWQFILIYSSFIIVSAQILEKESKPHIQKDPTAMWE